MLIWGGVLSFWGIGTAYAKTGFAVAIRQVADAQRQALDATTAHNRAIIEKLKLKISP
ncbi:MAG: hypothetical protein U1B84_28320 [Variovorax sp.]|nr:hypothetical protein [Variovorax sp.]